MEIKTSRIKFYPYKEWFFCYRKFKFIRGAYFRIFGFETRITEDNPTIKLIHIAKINSILSEAKVTPIGQ